MTDGGHNFTHKATERIGDSVRYTEDSQRTGEERPRIRRGSGFVPAGGVDARDVIIRGVPDDFGGVVQVERVVEGPDYASTLIMTPVSALDNPPVGPHVTDMAVARHTFGRDYKYAVWPVAAGPLQMRTEIVRAFKIGGRWRVEQTMRMAIEKILASVTQGSCRSTEAF